MMLAVMTIVTGRFPPPVKETFQHIRSIQELVSPRVYQQAQRAEKQRFELINSLDQSSPANPDNQGNSAEESILQQKIKALEFENLSLKSKLDNCTAPIRQSR